MQRSESEKEIRVLLVEDDPDDFYLTQDLLQSIERGRYVVVWAENYERAKLALAASEFDVTLVDYRIGEKTGLDFIAEVGPAFPKCPMILLTGLSDPDIDFAAEAAGAADYLVKDELTEALLDRSIRYARKSAQRRSLLDNVLSNSLSGMISVDSRDVPLIWNIRALDALDLAGPVQPTREMVAAALARIVAGAGEEPAEFTTADGRSFELSSNRAADGSGVIVLHDVTSRVTERKRTHEAMASLEQAQEELCLQSQRLIEAQRIGRISDWSFDPVTRAVSLSSEAEALIGLSSRNGVYKLSLILRLFGRHEARRFIEALQAALLASGTASIDVTMTLLSGGVVHLGLNCRVLNRPDGGIVRVDGTIQDITERKQANEQLERLAYFDPLTNIPNRTLFRRELSQRVERANRTRQSCYVLLLDLDRFKEVNDSLGHASGDELLQTVVGKLATTLRRHDFMARLGGDEFTIILADCQDESDVAVVAETLIETLREPFALERGEVTIGVSIGIVCAPKYGSDPLELLRLADLALYRAKDEGRNRFRFYTPDMNLVVQRRLSLDRDLRKAIGTGEGLEVYYQPQIDLAEHRVVGFEALMRWTHPVHGSVSPAEFISIAESSGLIDELGYWVLRRSVAQARNWIEAGHAPTEIAVNVSAAQIWQNDFVAKVEQALRDAGLPPHLLCLELTESLFADHNQGRVQEVLATLKKIGVKLALDDFGTGYSSLGYLTKLPFDKLKIDRCFVTGIAEDQEKRQLLQGIIALGRGLGMCTVAEGAEVADEAVLLQYMGCRQVQGYLFSRPSTAAVAIEFARTFDPQAHKRRMSHFPLAVSDSQLRIQGG